jgi:hypothetical protein
VVRRVGRCATRRIGLQANGFYEPLPEPPPPAALPRGFAKGVFRPSAPPMGWRSWNFFMCEIDQRTMQRQVEIACHAMRGYAMPCYDVLCHGRSTRCT